MSLNNPRFGDYLHRIYPNELKLKYATDSQSYYYLDLHIEIDNGGILETKLYDNRNDFTFPKVNFPFIQLHQRMELALHNSNVILTCVPRTVNVWTEPSLKYLYFAAVNQIGMPSIDFVKH
jgi:hypothetical protein